MFCMLVKAVMPEQQFKLFCLSCDFFFWGSMKIRRRFRMRRQQFQSNSRCVSIGGKFCGLMPLLTANNNTV